MNTIVQEFKKTHINLKKQFPQFKAGDTVRVHQKIVEGKKERIQIFEGLVIKKKGKNPLHTVITVRKISNGVGVEKIFPLITPSITEIDVVKRAKVRRAKLYFMRNLRGKKARLKETMTMDKTVHDVEEPIEEETTDIAVEESTEPEMDTSPEDSVTEAPEATTAETPETEVSEETVAETSDDTTEVAEDTEASETTAETEASDKSSEGNATEEATEKPSAEENTEKESS